MLFETSAKLSTNVELMFVTMAAKTLAEEQKRQQHRAKYNI